MSVLLYALLDKSLRGLASPEFRSLAGNSTMETTNVRAIAIDGISAMVALQPIGRWTRRAPRKAQSRCSGPRDWRLLVPDVIRPFDRIRVQRSCIFLRFAEL